MTLLGFQVTELVNVINDNWDVANLNLLATDLGVNLDNLGPNSTLKERAYNLVFQLNSTIPPRDGELLEQLLRRAPAVIKNAANRLLTPTYYIPTDDPHDAIVLGRFPFIGRPILRQVIREFTHPSAYSARVLVIRGDAPGGKSYSWWYLHHLAVSMVNATALVLHLKDTGYTPRQLFEQVALLLSIPTADLPDMTDNPQFARVDELVNWLKGRLPSLVRPYWLVIDDLNDESVTPALREAAYAIAYCAEVQKMNLWIALLGYSPPITDPSLRFILQEDAQFPEAAFVATYLARLAGLSPLPLPPARAQELANLIFSKYPNMDKESMDKISQEVEVMGQKLRIGQQP